MPGHSSTKTAFRAGDAFASAQWSAANFSGMNIAKAIPHITIHRGRLH
jgi:hypothetical protein